MAASSLHVKQVGASLIALQRGGGGDKRAVQTCLSDDGGSSGACVWLPPT